MEVHRTAVVEEGARLGEGVVVGPYAVIEGDVVVGDRCRIGPHAMLAGPLELGADCTVAASAVLGGDPQVKDNPGPFGAVRVGARNVFREFTQVNRSMRPDGATVLGDDNYLMATAHVAHDCAVGNHVVVCNGSMLAGHVTVQDRAFLSGKTGIHQFCRVGELAMVAGGVTLRRDTPPFCTVTGEWPARLAGLNAVGLRRAGIDATARRALQAAYRTLFRSDRPLSERIAAVEPTCPEVERLVAFVADRGRRMIVGFGGATGEEEEART